MGCRVGVRAGAVSTLFPAKSLAISRVGRYNARSLGDPA